ncbi:MAG: hypothetical protein ACFN0X_05875 [Mitsuokella sp.]
MLIFIKNAKKFLDLKNASKAYHALHYADGRVYATGKTSLIWMDGEFGKRGSYDFVTGEKADVRMPEFEKVIPRVNEQSVYAMVPSQGLTKLRAVLKGIAAMSAKVPDAATVYLTWGPLTLDIAVLSATISVKYPSEALMCNHTGSTLTRARVNAKSLADIVDYFCQRGDDMRIYAPLRVSLQTPLCFTAKGTGGVLSQVRNAEILQG